MAGSSLRSVLNLGACLRRLPFNNVSTNRDIHTVPTAFAARRGTREKARARKVKVEIAKVGFIPHNLRGKNKVKIIATNRHADDQHKKIPIDDVWPMLFFRSPIYSAVEAMKLHQETHHPTMYNEPDAYLYATVELNMEAVKKNRYVETFSRICLLPNLFSTDETRSILAFAKDPALVQQALNSGAVLAGGVEIIKKIQEGEVKPSDYDYIIAHPNIVTDLVPLRGLLKRRFPSLRNGTLDPDVAGMVKKLVSGIQYKAIQDENQKNYGVIEVPVGRLNMECEKVAENVGFLLKDINAGRPKRSGLFVTRCFLTSPPSREKLRIDPFVYIDREVSKTSASADDEESDDEQAAQAAAA